MKVPITVLIHTRNEAHNIRNCLECVKWADDIVVVDMYSEDETVEIAREYTNRIFFFENVGYVEPARQFALEQAKYDWILIVDADELVPIELKNALVKIMDSGNYDAVSIPRRNYIFGHLMEGTGWGPLQDKHIRFFKKSMMSFGSKIHGGMKIHPSSKIYQLNDVHCGFIHFNYIDVEQFLEKMNRYTTIEAKNLWDGNKKLNKGRIVRRILREFTGRFIKNKGYKDGFQGFLLACMMIGYQASLAMKLYLIEKYRTDHIREEICSQYTKIAKQEFDRQILEGMREHDKK